MISLQQLQRNAEPPELTQYDRYCLRLLMNGQIVTNGDAIRHLTGKGFITSVRELTEQGKRAIARLQDKARSKPGGRRSNGIHTARAAANCAQPVESEPA